MVMYNAFPIEIYGMVFSYMPVQQLLGCSIVCKEWFLSTQLCFEQRIKADFNLKQRLFKYIDAKLEYAMLYVTRAGLKCAFSIFTNCDNNQKLQMCNGKINVCITCFSSHMPATYKAAKLYHMTLAERNKLSSFKYREGKRCFVPEIKAYFQQQK